MYLFGLCNIQERLSSLRSNNIQHRRDVFKESASRYKSVSGQTIREIEVENLTDQEQEATQREGDIFEAESEQDNDSSDHSGEDSTSDTALRTSTREKRQPNYYSV